MFSSVFLEEGQRKEPKLGVKGERGAEKGHRIEPGEIHYFVPKARIAPWEPLGQRRTSFLASSLPSASLLPLSHIHPLQPAFRTLALSLSP